MAAADWRSGFWGPSLKMEPLVNGDSAARAATVFTRCILEAYCLTDGKFFRVSSFYEAFFLELHYITYIPVAPIISFEVDHDEVTDAEKKRRSSA